MCCFCRKQSGGWSGNDQPPASSGVLKIIPKRFEYPIFHITGHNPDQVFYGNCAVVQKPPVNLGHEVGGEQIGEKLQVGFVFFFYRAGSV